MHIKSLNYAALIATIEIKPEWNISAPRGKESDAVGGGNDLFPGFS